MVIQTGLDYIRSRSIVDCDTMDEQVARTLGPFADCTSNQAIAYGELSKPKHASILQISLSKSKSLVNKYPGLAVEELAIEIAMISLSLKIAPYITGYIHIQINPYNAYSTKKTVANALRIISLTQHLNPTYPSSRICIKIPSTWEGLQACQILERAGIRTLATTLFTLPQAALAAEMGCMYVAPYVNQLKVHFEDGFTDPAPLLPLCAQIQQYYASIGTNTQVLPASLTSVDEIYALAGVQHITISPGLLEELAKPLANAAGMKPSLFDNENPAVVGSVPERLSFLHDEAGYRIAFSRHQAGESEGKLTQAVNIFCDMQDKLVRLFEWLQQPSRSASRL
ncbi:transaldolase [Aspergillus heteromorphus CBS 117.55]|uniref:Transaldolase n=1 Tax=Aspergillus heteromorphus CBS 117.55 TaxID=1448321 RepID=A0A317WWM4_9EURO|nr:transaldolase [Aspergillus heteromorphus CBS 117.55]PWY90769.1 transaldolase [Aspergillus heteromorphus CBS 117.55]